MIKKKKSKFTRSQMKNVLVIVLFFLAAFVSANILDTLPFHILAIAFIIVGVYGIVVLGKGMRFVF